MNKPSPLVAGVVDALCAAIRSGNLKSGRGLPSERQLSSDHEVSRLVIRAAIQELDRMGMVVVKPHCRPTVSATIKPLRAKSIQGIRHISIWLWPNTRDFCAASILQGIQSAAVPADLRLVVGNVVSGDWTSVLDSEAAFLQSVAADPQAAGLILWYLGGLKNLKHLEAVREAGVPIVFVDRQPPVGFDADFVGTDNEGAAQRGVHYLIDRGHRRIALVTNADKVSSVLARESGYRRALKDAGIPADPDLVFEDSRDGPEGVEMILDSLLASENPPTAIFGINDLVALQIYESLGKRGISVPEDISVLGFDGLLRWVPGRGALTSAHQEFERIGQTATELVLERISQGFFSAHRHVLFDAPVKPLGSTDRPKTPLPIRSFT